MKAIVSTRYGAADSLRLQEVDHPTVEPGRVLVRVRAASVNALDWRVMRGEPYFARPLMGGLRGPKPAVRGVDLAGVVEAVGADVNGFQPGDEVFGTGRGTFAEVASADPLRLAPKPAALTFEEAAALPIAGVTALQAVRERGRIEAGQRVLVNGAAGGVGTLTVQLAKAFGADVTAVCSTANVELARSLGADRVVDYTADDFTRTRERYDVIVDNAGNRPLRALRRVLTPHGTLVVVGGGRGRLLGGLGRKLTTPLLDRFVSQRLVTFIASVTRENLLAVAELAASGSVHAVVDRTYTLADAVEAVRYVDTGHARAKVVITPGG